MKEINGTNRNTPPCGKQKAPHKSKTVKEKATVTPSFVTYTEGIDTRTVLKWVASTAIVLGGYAIAESFKNNKKTR